MGDGNGMEHVGETNDRSKAISGRGPDPPCDGRGDSRSELRDETKAYLQRNGGERDSDCARLHNTHFGQDTSSRSESR